MKYIRTYGDYNSWKLDYSNPDRGFRLKPTLYRYPYTGYEDAILLELDDPRKHGDSTYIKIYIDSDTEFSFYIGNKPGDTQTTMTCTIDWGDGVIEDKNITTDDKGFKLSHSYTGRNFRAIELYNVERDYSIVGDGANTKSLISHPSIVKNVILGNSVVSIGTYAFYNCSNLTSIHIPESVTDIGNYALRSCKSLSSIYIPEGVTSIGERVFEQCSSLTSVYIPEGVTTIEDGAFKNCTSLTSVYIPEGVTSIGERVFEQCSSLVSVYIPEGVTSIGRHAFTYCTSLTSVYIPEGVTTIEDGAFKNCTSLTSVYIPEGVTTIGDTTYEGVFENCSSLTSIYIPRSVTSIGRNAFKGCSSLTSINIPEGVTTIDDGTFNNCTSLSSISLHSTTVPTINGSAFEYLPANGTLHIRRGIIDWMWEAMLDYFDNWTIVEDL